MFAVILAFGLLIVAPATAFAQGWQEYSYPESGFAIQFPAAPIGVSALAGVNSSDRQYVLDRDGVRYTVSVRDIPGGAADKARIIEEAASVVRAKGDLEVESRPRVDREFGRAVVVGGKDGNRYSAVIFLVGNTLYEIMGVYEPSNSWSGNVMRFQMSFRLLH